MSANYAALDLLATRTIEWNEQKAKLEKELRSAQDSESVFHGQLEKAAKSLMDKDDRIFVITEDGRDQYTFSWSRARLALCVNSATVSWLTRRLKLKSCNWPAASLMLRMRVTWTKSLRRWLAKLMVRRLQPRSRKKRPRRRLMKRPRRKKSERHPPQSTFYLFFFIFRPHFLNIKTSLPIDKDLELLGCNLNSFPFPWFALNFYIWTRMNFCLCLSASPYLQVDSFMSRRQNYSMIRGWIVYDSLPSCGWFVKESKVTCLGVVVDLLKSHC